MNKMYTFFLYIISTSMIHTNMLLDMASMLAAQQGANDADQMISDEFASITTNISSIQSDLKNQITSFNNEIKKNQTTTAKTVFNIFAQAQTKTNNKQTDYQNETNNLFNFIQQAITFPQYQGSYLLLGNQGLIGSINLDVLFELGTMYTPTGPIWKNIFAIGDWEYDVNSDSFLQTNLHPLYSKINGQKSTLQAPQNSIFTEFYTQQLSYDIQCEITIYQTEFPFFAGITFNRTRWISGNPDSSTKWRMCGIAGVSSTSAGAYYSEQYTNTKLNTNPIQYPIDQILQGEANTILSLNAQTFNNTQGLPVTYAIHIINSPKTIKIKIWDITTKEPSTFTTITTKDPTLYLFHNIGFICPGAIAQFKLIKPTSLLFSSTAKQTFTQSLNSLLTSPAPQS